MILRINDRPISGVPALIWDQMRLQRSAVEAQGRATAAVSSDSGAATPFWKGVVTLVKYRTVCNHCARQWLMQCFADKFIFSVLMATLYRGVGSNLSPANYPNIASFLFMWTAMPACASPVKGCVWYLANH